jgi:electron transfer flavoprotein beta subunit
VAEGDEAARGGGAGGLAPADLRPDVDPLTGEVRVDSRWSDLTAADAAALEHARRAADAWGGRLVAVAAGSAGVDGALRRAVALGASAWRVPWSAAGRPEPASPSDGPVAGPHSLDGSALAGDQVGLARRLAAVLSELGPPDLVICGDRSAYRGTGALPALLAHYLGASQALGVVSLEVEGGGNRDAVIAERRLDGGWRERLRLSAPAVCSVEAAGVQLRRAPLAGALEAAGDPIPTWPSPLAPAATAAMATTAATAVPGRWQVGPPRPYRPRTKVVPAPEGSTRDRLLALTGALVAHDPPRLVGPVDADEAVDELLEFLGRHGYLDRQDDDASP